MNINKDQLLIALRNRRMSIEKDGMPSERIKEVTDIIDMVEGWQDPPPKCFYPDCQPFCGALACRATELLNHAFGAGQSACIAGAAKSDNPYIEGDVATAWTRGWQGQHEAITRELQQRTPKTRN